jgi:hypothetical protein
VIVAAKYRVPVSVAAASAGRIRLEPADAHSRTEDCAHHRIHRGNHAYVAGCGTHQPQRGKAFLTAGRGQSGGGADQDQHREQDREHAGRERVPEERGVNLRASTGADRGHPLGAWHPR